MNFNAHELNRAIAISKTGILWKSETLTLSALTETLIHLNSILQNLEKAGTRVTFSDDVSEGDITDLVNYMRNAACHIDSGNNKLGTNTLVFNSFAGLVPNAIEINGTKIGCDYADDVAFNFGAKVIYLKRHIEKLMFDILPPLI